MPEEGAQALRAAGSETRAAAQRPARLRLSVVIPCFNEEAVLAQTHGRLIAVLESVPDLDGFELVYVDDGSRDATLAILEELQAGDDRVRFRSLSRNFGHQVAVTAGLDSTAGDAVVIIDADLQDPPELIPQMLAEWRKGFDVVRAERRSREGETWFKRWSAAQYYRALDYLSETQMPRNIGDFTLLDSRVVAALREMPEQARYLRGMVSWVGYRQTTVLFDRAARAAGETHYTWRKMLRLGADGILSFSTKPLRLAMWIGLSAAGLSVLGICYALVLRLLTDIWVSGWTLLFIAIMFFGGVQLVVLGVIGQYIGLIFEQAKGRPLYLVKAEGGLPEQRRPTG